jgi:hypothetical protein
MENKKTEQERKEYTDFMYNEDNVDNCENCPANDGFTGEVKPCGQFRCWVLMHKD